jgi:hypothetical protein
MPAILKFLPLFLGIVLCFAGCSKEAGKSAAPGSPVLAATTVLATIVGDEKPQAVPTPAMHVPLGQTADLKVMFSELGGGVAYTAEKDGKSYVVHNGKAGKQYTAIGETALSPNGRRVAYAAFVDGKWRMVTDGMEGSSFDSIALPLFSPDGKHLIYKAMLGEKWFVVVDNRMNEGTKTSYSRCEFNADSTLVAYTENANDKIKVRMVISDLGFKKQTVMAGVGSLLIMNDARTRIAAVSQENGKQRMIEFSFNAPNDVRKGELYDSVNNPVFGPDGLSLAYEAVKGGERFLVFNNREEKLSKRPFVGPPVIRPDLKAVGAIVGNIDPASQHLAVSSAGNAAGLHEYFVNDARKGKEYMEAKYLAYNRDGSAYAHAARTGQNWFVVVNGHEGPPFDRVVTPVFTPDGEKLVYRARKDGMRFVVLADMTGKTIKQFPSYEQVFQPVFTSDGKSIAYGVKDGNKLIWQVEKL